MLSKYLCESLHIASGCIFLVCMLLVCTPIRCATTPLSSAGGLSKNSWVVLVDTSKFWFNYRHIGNVLGIYRSVKRLGVPDSRILLMIADDAACNARNPRPGRVYNIDVDRYDLYGDDLEIDYRCGEVTVENFVRLLTGRHPPSTPASKRLLTDEQSHVVVYMTGHGGDGFIKFQDNNEASSVELADAIEQMRVKRRYREMIYIADTCQAEGMGKAVYSPGVITIGSSRVGEDSLSYHHDRDIGVHVSDRYSHYLLEFLESVQLNDARPKTLRNLLEVCPYWQCLSNVAFRTDLYARDVDRVPVIDFFADRRPVITFDSAAPQHANASRSYGRSLVDRLEKLSSKSQGKAEQHLEHFSSFSSSPPSSSQKRTEL